MWAQFHNKNYALSLWALLSILLPLFLNLKSGDAVSVLILGNILLLLFAASAMITIGHQQKSSLSTLDFFFLGWLVWTAFMIMMGWIEPIAYFGLLQCSLWLMFYWICRFGMLSPNFSSFVKILFYSLATLNAFYACLQFFILHLMPIGFFACKTTSAAFSMFMLLIATGDFLTKKPSLRMNGVLIHLLIFLLFLDIFISMSRGVMLCLTLFSGLTFILCRSIVNKTHLYHWLLLMSMTLVIVLIFAQPELHHRFDLLKVEKSRTIIWEAAWHLWQNTPWYGAGLMSFKHHYPKYSLPGDNSTGEYAHNDYLQLLIETGVPGLILVGCIAFLLLHSFIKFLKSPISNPNHHIQLICTYTAFFALASHSLIDFNFYIPMMNITLGYGLFLIYQKIDETYHSYPLMLQTHRINILKNNKILMLRRVIVIFIFMISTLIFYAGFRLGVSEYYIHQSITLTEKHQIKQAYTSLKKAIDWFDSFITQSYLAELNLQRANNALTDETQKKWAMEGSKAATQALRYNADLARPYFILALSAVLYSDTQKDTEFFFNKAIEHYPQGCIERTTYARYLIEQNKLLAAESLLEQGLHYPIHADCVELYFNYLAKLRYANHHEQAAKAVLYRLQHLQRGRSDYSDLLISSSQ